MDPSVPWTWVDAARRGRGKLVAAGVQFVVLPEGEPLAVGWTDGIPSLPLVSPAGTDASPPAGSHSGEPPAGRTTG